MLHVTQGRTDDPGRSDARPCRGGAPGDRAPRGCRDPRRSWTAPTWRVAFIGAGALVRPRTKVPPRTLWLGSPARQVRVLTEAEVADLAHYHRNYLGYKEEYFRTDGRWAK